MRSLGALTTLFVAFLPAPLAGGLGGRAQPSRGPRRAPSAVDVAIIGGGPCGLATAIALAKAARLKGCSVCVFERDDFSPKGAAVALSPLSWSALEAIDGTVAARIRQEGSPVVAVEVRPLHRATDVAAPAERSAPAHEQLLALWRGWLRALGPPPAPVQTTFLWHEVRAQLKARATELLGERGSLCSGLELVGLEPEGEGIALRFRGSGDETLRCRARIVLACDGVQSSARAAAPTGPRAAAVLLDEEKSVWRGISPEADVRGVATFFREAHGSRMGLLFPAGRGRGASWTVTAPAAPGRARDAADAKARLFEALRAPAEAGGVDEAFAAALAGSTSIVEHRLVSRNWAAPWHSGVGRLAYLGDAAHPLRPTGEGLALALEDAWLVGRLAADAPTAEAFLQPATLRAYEDARLPRVRAVAEATSAAAKAAYSPQPTARARTESVATASGRGGASADRWHWAEPADGPAPAAAAPPRALSLAEAVAAHPLHEAFGPL